MLTKFLKCAQRCAVKHSVTQTTANGRSNCQLAQFALYKPSTFPVVYGRPSSILTRCSLITNINIRMFSDDGHGEDGRKRDFLKVDPRIKRFITNRFIIQGIPQDVTKDQLIEALKDYTYDDYNFRYKTKEEIGNEKLGFCRFGVDKTDLSEKLLQIVNSENGTITVGKHNLKIK